MESFTGNLILEFGDFFFEAPRYNIKECKDRYSTYASPLKVEVRLFNQETGEVKEQEIYLGDMPIMTDSGSFVINGAERVIVSQLVRSPSVYFGREVDKNGRVCITSQVIPTRGTWLEYETDTRGVIYVRIDRTRKVTVTTFLRALGLSSDEDILSLIHTLFDCRPGAIIEQFSLLHPTFKYEDLASYGHFGRPDLNLPWEKLDKVDAILEFLKDKKPTRA